MSPEGVAWLAGLGPRAVLGSAARGRDDALGASRSSGRGETFQHEATRWRHATSLTADTADMIVLSEDVKIEQAGRRYNHAASEQETSCVPSSPVESSRFGRHLAALRADKGEPDLGRGHG